MFIGEKKSQFCFDCFHWKSLSRCITMYQNETTNKFSREIALEHVILELNTDDERGYYFQIRTEQNNYYCGCKRTRSRVRMISMF